MTKMKDKILDKIEKQNIEPTSKSYFDWIERAKWMLIGMFSIFSMIFISFLIDDAIDIFSYGPGIFNGPGLWFFLPPLIWLVIILTGIYFIIREFRKTNTGYKYSLKFIAGIGLLLFLLAPLLAFRAGIGPRMHSDFIDRMPFVEKFVYNEKLWNNADEGKLAGIVILLAGKELKLKSPDLKIWKVTLEKEFISLKYQPEIGERVRLVGEKTGELQFRAAKVFPWFGRGGMMRGGKIMDPNFPRGEMMRGRGEDFKGLPIQNNFSGSIK